MTFGSPLLLLTLLVVPLAVLGWWWAQRRRSRYALAFTNMDVLASVAERQVPWRRLVPAALALLALTGLCIAAARPRVVVNGTRDEGTVVLLVDVSRSMVAKDVKPSRLGAARDAIRAFLNVVPKKFAVGIMSFSTESNLVSPVTTDRAMTRAAVDYLLPEGGTAIGDGIAHAVQVGRAAQRARAQIPGGKAAPVSILMLSDGAQRSGILQPAQGAERAKKAGIKIYPIALGTPDGTVELGFGPFGGRPIPVPPDPATLKRIAAITDGEFFAAPSADALHSAYEHLGTQVARARVRVEATSVFAAAAAGLLAVAGALSLLWSSRLP